MDVTGPKGKLLARTFTPPKGLGFFVHIPNEFILQPGFNRLAKGRECPPHFHTPKGGRHEVILVLEGRIRVDVFGDDSKKASCFDMGPGEAVLLTAGHGIVVLEDSLLFEVKQGPYPGPEKDKKFIYK